MKRFYWHQEAIVGILQFTILVKYYYLIFQVRKKSSSHLACIPKLDSIDVPVPQSEALHLLKGHKKGVSDLRWSSHDDKYLLVSGADDNLVVVWDITLGKNISVFNKHRGSVLCVCWNPMNPDVIFSGSEDRFLYEWNHNDFICTDSVSCKFSFSFKHSESSTDL